jgi:hypothetical protein
MARPKASARLGLLGVLVALFLAATGGCVSPVRLVEETANGGVVRMPANTNHWPTYYRARAEFLMHQKCPGGYQIDQEAAVGGDLGSHPHESYFGYTGGSDLDQIYHITFHGVPWGNPQPAAALPRTAKLRTAASPSSSVPPASGPEELPSPRRLPPSPEEEGKTP